jgi:hypothetical protein
VHTFFTMDKLIDWAVLILCVILFFRLQAVTIVRFYRSSCPACVRSEEEWQRFKMKNMWNPIIKCVEVNTETQEGKALMKQYGFQYVPTIMKVKGLQITEYKGDRNADDLTRFAMACD